MIYTEENKISTTFAKTAESNTNIPWLIASHNNANKEVIIRTSSDIVQSTHRLKKKYSTIKQQQELDKNSLAKGYHN